MSDSFDRVLVTAALPYANGPLHIGHLAGAYLPGDVYCRYQRLLGRDVAFICGSDEHGVPIMLRARREGVNPQEIVDRYHTEIHAAFKDLGVSFDHYGRTSSKTHRETSQAFFKHLAEQDQFVCKTESQLYDPEAHMFLADRFVRGTCPSCDFDDAYGDQCEKCGRALSPSELKNPRSAITNATPELRETTHWYLPLGAHQAWLEEFIGSHPEWKANVLGQVKSWFQDGLGDRAVTRDLPWGVPLPESVSSQLGTQGEGKVLYVWFDAPIGYISATREWAQNKGEPESWELWWKDPKSKLVHFIGKDNIVFHCIIFPTMLKLHGDYVLPDNVPANEFLNLEGNKISTSRAWAVWAKDFLKELPADYLRYGLLRILPEAKDADFSWSELQAHINNELADTFGNLVNRTVKFAAQYFDGKIPPLVDPSPADQEAIAALAQAPAAIGDHLERYRFRDALNEAMNLARMGNKYFNDQAPWATRKTDMQTCGNTLHVSLQICASLSILLEPMLPHSCASLRTMLGLTNVRASSAGGSEQGLGWNDAGRALLQGGTELGEPVILVQKIDDELVQAQRAKLEEQAKQATPEPEGGAYTAMAETCTFDDFMKVDLRVGEVVACERVKKSKKLLRCDVNLGFETRQILAGVAEHLSPEDLIGTRVIVVATLKPRKMMGLESQGMILMAEGREGGLRPVTTDQEPGATVR